MSEAEIIRRLKRIEGQLDEIKRKVDKIYREVR